MKLACLLSSVLASATAATAQAVIYSNFRAINQYSAAFDTLAAGAQIAMPFSVPAGSSHFALTVEFAAQALAGTTTVSLRFVSGGVDPGAGTALGAALPAVTLSTAPAIHNVAAPLLPFPPGSYWCIATNTGAQTARWMRNSAGVNGATQRWNGSSWVQQGVAAVPTLRIKGALQGQSLFEPRPAYGTFTAPSGAGRAELLLEIICPGSPPTNPFTMPVGADLPANATPLQICEALANAINACGCSCWGNCPSTAPYGFRAECVGSTLRVSNSTSMSCLGSFVCIDKVDYVSRFPGMFELSGVGGALRLELAGVATGVPIDPTAATSLTVTRLLRCGPVAPQQPITATVALTAGMGAQQIMNALAASLTAQGDNQFTLAGTRMTFQAACSPTADYDIAFQSNDTGLDYAYSPPFAYSMFTYIQQGSPSSVSYAGTASSTSFGTPTLAAAGGRPVIGNAAFRFDAGSLTPFGFGVLAMDLNPLAPVGIPVPGASPSLLLYVSPTLLFSVLGVAGSASFPLPLPNSPPLLGAVASAQFFDLDPTLPFSLPFGGSQGCQITIGNL